ncbi:AAA family ATPase [Mesorhizobium sp. M1156]|uniref:AAA family ATPase n=1 Tax=Mesorhizobium sp. M1156 TaxID=2957064 RepID=UPI003339878B
MSVESSPGNAHHWYFFDRALPWEEADLIGARLRAAAGADSDTGNITQPYRAAGTPNLLTPKKRARGRIGPSSTRILSEGGPIYTADQLRAALPELPLRDISAGVEGSSRGIAVLLADMPDRLHEELKTPADQLDDRSSHFFGVTGKLKVRGYSVDEVAALWDHYADAAGAKFAPRRGGVRHQLEHDWPKLDTRAEAAAKGLIEPDDEAIAAMQSPEATAAFAEIFGSRTPPITKPSETGLGAQPTPLETVRASDLAGLPIPKREFMFADLLPARNVTAMYGDGGVGKSLLALQASIAVATGTKWLGMEPKTIGPVVYFSAEDETAEMHIRLADICAADEIDMSKLTDLHIADMAGQDALLAVENSKVGIMSKRPLFERLRLTLGALRPVMLVIDNLADVFGGNEISKPLARQFIGFLRNLSIEFNCYVFLLAHPSQSGKNSGEGTSGNSAWSNSVRQRLYLHRPEEEDADEFVRDLKVMKSNYTAKGYGMELRWDRGRFTSTSGAPARIAGNGAGRAAMDAKVDAAFLTLLAKVNHQGLRVFPRKGNGYAPNVFAEHAEAKGITKAQFAASMRRLFDAGQIILERVGKPSAPVERIVIVPVEEVPM